MPGAKRFEGNYSDYHESQLSLKNDTPKQEQAKQNQRNNREKDNQKKGLSFKEKREFEELTAAIEALETEKQELEDFFSSGQTDVTGQNQKKYSEICSKLEQSYPRWEELAELAD